MRESPTPRLSKAGMPSHSEGWGGLFKGEQYRLIRSASRASIRWLRVFEQTTPALRACPSLLRRGLALAVLGNSLSRLWLRSVAAPRLKTDALRATSWTATGLRPGLTKLVPLLILLAAGSCRQSMANEPRYRTYQESDFFANGS